MIEGKSALGTAPPEAPAEYVPRLGLFSGTMMVVGGIIGSGIFLNPAIVAARVRTAGLTLAVWVIGGVIALIGALVYAELGARRPVAGGGYVYLRDAYLSVMEALRHGGIHHGRDVQIHWIASDDLGGEATEEALGKMDGILIPGGFGVRGVEGKVDAARYAREQQVPFLGICLGLQCAVIEYARHVCGLGDANSSEFAPGTPDPVIDLLPEQKNVTDLGASMRLGAQPCYLEPGTLAARSYGQEVVEERHRHRWEVNPAYLDVLRQHGMVISGSSQKGRLAEIIELPDHPFFIAGQFHPELRSRPTRPHPLFREFVGAAKARAAERSRERRVTVG